MALLQFPAQLIALLEERAAGLAPDVRRTLVQALMLLRNRGLVTSLALLRVFFGLFRVHDKPLRALVAAHIVADVRRLNGEAGGKRDDAASRGVQSALYALAGDADTGTAKRALDVLMELYRRRIWTDARTVNVIASASLTSSHTKLLVAGLRFFLGIGDEAAAAAGAASDSEDESEGDEGGVRGGPGGKEGSAGVAVDARALREARSLHAHSKRTRRRDRQTERAVTALKKHSGGSKTGGGAPIWPAIQLLHDPQGIAEKLFAALRVSRERFEVSLSTARPRTLLHHAPTCTQAQPRITSPSAGSIDANESSVATYWHAQAAAAAVLLVYTAIPGGPHSARNSSARLPDPGSSLRCIASVRLQCAVCCPNYPRDDTSYLLSDSRVSRSLVTPIHKILRHASDG